MTAAAILSIEGTTLTPRERAFLREADPFGLILFSRNIDSPWQLRALTTEIRTLLGRDCLILTDQEGGRVQRLGPPHWRKWRSALTEVLRAGPKAERVMYLRAALIGAELWNSGIDTDCAPCADVAGPVTHRFLRNRCFGFDPVLVTRIARVTARGLEAGGCLPVMKHLPGHGAARADSHHALPRVDEDRATLRRRDFAPFRGMAALPMAMTAHVLYPAYDPYAPATLSPAVIRAIRSEIGFSGLLMTDDLTMEALQGSLATRAAGARAAGCDLVLYSKANEAEAAEVIGACGTLDGLSRMRADAALAARPAGPSIDIAACEAEFLALTGEGGE